MVRKTVPIRLPGQPVFCGALLRDKSGRTCRLAAGHDTSHPGWGRCALHGGATETHIAAAQYAQAAATAQLFGVPRQVDPIIGLMQAYWQTAGVLDAIEAMCVRLLPDDVTWGVQSLEETKIGEDESEGEGSLTPPETKTRSGASVNIWVKLFAEWHDRFFREGEAILKLNLEGRRIELGQAQLAIMAKLLFSPDLGLSQDQMRVVARLLRELDRAEPEGIAA